MRLPWARQGLIVSKGRVHPCVLHHQRAQLLDPLVETKQREFGLPQTRVNDKLRQPQPRRVGAISLTNAPRDLRRNQEQWATRCQAR